MHGFLILLLGLCSTTLLAASSSYLFTEEVSVATGCQRAAERVKMEAIASQCGAHLSGGSLRVQGDHQDQLDRLYFESTAGYVKHYQLIDQQVAMVSPIPDESLFRCTVEAELEVQCDQGERDPQFSPLFEQQVSLNQIHFQDGEEMVIEIVPRQSMHITILQLIPYLQGEERVWRIFPNAYQSQSVLQGDQPILIPDGKQDQFQLIATLPMGEQRVVEELVVVATRIPVRFPEKMSVEQFHRLLAEVPLSQRRELFIPYEITQSRHAGVTR